MGTLLRSILSASFLETRVLGETVEDWLLIAFVVGVAVLLAQAAQAALVWVARRLHRVGAARVRRILLGLLRDTTRPFLFAVALYVGGLLAGWDGDWLDALAIFAGVASIVQVGAWATGVISVYVDQVEESERRGSLVTRVQVGGALVWIVVWVLVGVLIVANLGLDVTTTLAGVGIGGIAVTFALRGALENLFAALSIVIAKPFAVGDLLAIGEGDGVIEADVRHVGLKSTRLRSLTGEEVIVPNADLLASRLRNYEHMWRQRIDLPFRVGYATPRATLREIPGIVEAVISGLSGEHGLATLEHDRTNLRAFGPSALEFETKYYVEDKTQLAADAAHNAILLGILDAFDARGIEIPLRTLRVEAASETGADRLAHPDD